MSSLPGLTLEAYLAWDYNLVIENQSESNVSLGMAEMLGTSATSRIILTEEQFVRIVAMYEKYREQVENKLGEFNEETQSWRTYAHDVFSFLPADLEINVFAYLESLNLSETKNEQSLQQNDISCSTDDRIASRQNVIMYLFRFNVDMQNPVVGMSEDKTKELLFGLPNGWIWHKQNMSDKDYNVVMDVKVIDFNNSEHLITADDVKAYKDSLLKSVKELHPELPIGNETVVESKETLTVDEFKDIPAEYITKESLKYIRSTLTLHKTVKKLSDAIALLTVHTSCENKDQDDFVKARISTILRDIRSTTTSSPLDYVTGNGPIAKYLLEKLYLKDLFAISESEKLQLFSIKNEIDQKFNLKPVTNLLSIEWKNIVQSMIELQTKFLTVLTPESLWTLIKPTDRINKSGFYKTEDGQLLIALVFHLDGLLITIPLQSNSEPIISVFHEWEEENINIYGICYFPGMFNLMHEEIQKIIPEEVNFNQ